MKMLSVLYLLMTVCIARGATIFVTQGNYPGSPFPVTLQSISGSFVPAGTRVRVGFFQNLNFSPADCTLVGAEIAANFVPLGELTSPAGLGTPADNTVAISPATNGPTGNISNVVIGDGLPNTVTPGSLSRGTRIFLVVEHFDGGVFSATNWVVPPGGTGNMLLRLADIDTPAEVFWGQLGTNSLIVGSLCPEPGAAMLLMVMALGFAARRR